MKTAPPQLPERHLHKVPLRTSGQQQSRYALRSSILRMFRDHQVNRLNRTGNEMMCSIRRQMEDLMRSGKDWTLMLQSYLILSLEVFDDSEASKSGSAPSLVFDMGT